MGQSETSDGLAPNQRHFAVLIAAFQRENDAYVPRWKVECERRGEDHVRIPCTWDGPTPEVAYA